MSSTTCHHCGCSEIDIDPARGDAVCTNCGSVLEDTIIVNEVQFEEGSHGGSRAIGQLVSAEGQSSGLNIGGYQHGIGRESRMVTLQNARKRISHLAEQLRLNQHCVETAYKFYRMALSRQLTRGRKNSHVIAACLYLVCRSEGTSHMLLDLSDVLQVNVYELGKTYLKLSRELCINVPAIDPCLYILRFAHHLQFGDKTEAVAHTALRMVERMKKDWIHAGRRPSGLCGAALLVAARMNNFNRTVKDIIKVVKVCETTLRKRLTEFGDTPSSRLTLDEFRTVSLEEEQDPPSFKEARRKQKIEQLEEDIKMKEAEEEIRKLQTLIDRVLENSRKKKGGLYAKYAHLADEESVDDAASVVSETSMAEDFIFEKTMETVEEVLNDNSEQQQESQEPTEEVLDSQRSAVVPTQEALEDIYLPKHSAFKKQLRPTAASLGLKNSIEEYMKIGESDETEEQEGGELDLTGLDDKELDAYIMTEDEAKLKAKLWMQVHAEYLKEMKEKEERKAKEMEENAQKPEQKKRKRARRSTIKSQNTAGEAIEKIIQEKKISNKINYDVLRSLSNKDTVELASAAANKKEDESEAMKKTKQPPRKKPRMQGPTLSTSSIRGLITSIVGKDKLKPPLVEDDMDIQEKNNAQEAASKAEPEPEAVPPVEEVPEEEEEEEEEYYEDEPEEEAHMSAAQLLGQHRGEEYDDYGDDYYD